MWSFLDVVITVAAYTAIDRIFKVYGQDLALSQIINEILID
jgi:hypothetical protein